MGGQIDTKAVQTLNPPSDSTFGIFMGAEDLNTQESFKTLIESYQQVGLPLEGVIFTEQTQENYMVGSVDGEAFPDLSSFKDYLAEKNVSSIKVQQSGIST